MLRVMGATEVTVVMMPLFAIGADMTAVMVEPVAPAVRSLIASARSWMFSFVHLQRITLVVVVGGGGCLAQMQDLRLFPVAVMVVLVALAVRFTIWAA